MLNLIAYVDVGFFVHATENLSKVFEAVQQVLPIHYYDKIKFRKYEVKGYYGNRISIFEARIKSEEIIKALIEKLSSRITQINKETLLRKINLHVSKGSFYLRFDKQAACLGELKLSTADPIHVRIRFKKKNTEDIISICREMGILP